MMIERIILVLLACLLWSPLALSQRPGMEVPLITPGPGWKTCPRCENDAHIEDGRQKANVDTHAFDPRDLSGVWGNDGIRLTAKVMSPFTPEGKKAYDALLKEVGDGHGAGAPNDPLNICDPLGTARAFGYNYGFEFVQTPGRVFQFFELSHTWRTIWTDGRKLPDDPPVDRWFGYSIGHWEGDTFVVESSGYDQRSLLGSSSAFPLFPHSSELRIIERYKRLNYGLLQASLMVTDPKIFMTPWTSGGTIKLLPNAELGEYMCVPSESIQFNERQTIPSEGGPEKNFK
jgi:hypothetical protein